MLSIDKMVYSAEEKKSRSLNSKNNIIHVRKLNKSTCAFVSYVHTRIIVAHIFILVEPKQLKPQKSINARRAI